MIEVHVPMRSHEEDKSDSLEEEVGFQAENQEVEEQVHVLVFIFVGFHGRIMISAVKVRCGIVRF